MRRRKINVLILVLLIGSVSSCTLFNSHEPPIANIILQPFTEPLIDSFSSLTGPDENIQITKIGVESNALRYRTFDLPVRFKEMMFLDTQATLFALCRNSKTEQHNLCSQHSNLIVTLQKVEIKPNKSLIFEVRFDATGMLSDVVKLETQSSGLVMASGSLPMLKDHILKGIDLDIRLRAGYEQVLGEYYAKSETLRQDLSGPIASL